MAKGELFDISEIKVCRGSLTKEKREVSAREIIQRARMRIKYFYTLRETCGILHCSYDELLTLITKYRLDVIFFLSARRIPWWDLAGFMLDTDDDLEEALHEYLQAIARKPTN
jgi:hypothetical protein